MQKKETWTHEELKVRLATAMALARRAGEKIAFETYITKSEAGKKAAEDVAEFWCGVAFVAGILGISSEELKACTVTDEQAEALDRELKEETERRKRDIPERFLKDLFEELGKRRPNGVSFRMEHDGRTIFG